MKTLEIESELDKTQSRIEELEMARERQTVAVAATQKAFIDGKADVAKLNDEQGKLSLYEQTIESLKATYQSLKSRFESESADQTRREMLKQMASAANQVEPLVNDYLKTRSEFNEIVSKYAPLLVERREAYTEKQREYRRIVSQIEPTGEEIHSSGLQQRTLTMASTGFINYPSIEFERVIIAAEQAIAGKIADAARAKRQTAGQSI
jgi:chromosome segregation ATPase